MLIGIGFVILALAMIVGPIMMMKPSGRQTQLATMRQKALMLGMQTSLVPVPKPLSGATHAPMIAVYYKRWESFKWSDDTALLLRLGFEHDIHFSGPWDWAENHTADITADEEMHKLLKSLPSSVLGVEFGPLGVGLYWLESKVNVEAINQCLSVIQDKITNDENILQAAE